MHLETEELLEETVPKTAPTSDEVNHLPEPIVTKSAKLFAKNGYHATGISELLGVLGVSRGALYHHIAGKEDLLFEICQKQVESMNSQASEIAAKEIPVDERLQLMARTLLSNIAEHLDEWTVFFREFEALSEERRSVIVRARSDYERLWEDLLLEGVEGGVLRSHSPLVVKGVLGMFNYAYLWYRPEGSREAIEVADEFVDVLLNGLVVRPAAADTSGD